MTPGGEDFPNQTYGEEVGSFQTDDESELSTTSCQRNRHAVDEGKDHYVDLLAKRRKTLGDHSGRFLFKKKQNYQTNYFLQVTNKGIQSTSNFPQVIK